MSTSPQFDFVAAAKAIEAGQPLYQWVGLSKDLMRVLYASAVGLYESGQYVEALGALQQLTLLDPRNVDHWALLGNNMMRLGEFAQAVTAWRVAMSLEPTFNMAATVLRTALALKDKEAAAEALLVARMCRLTQKHDDEYDTLWQAWSKQWGG